MPVASMHARRMRKARSRRCSGALQRRSCRVKPAATAQREEFAGNFELLGKGHAVEHADQAGDGDPSGAEIAGTARNLLNSCRLAPALIFIQPEDGAVVLAADVDAQVELEAGCGIWRRGTGRIHR